MMTAPACRSHRRSRLPVRHLLPRVPPGRRRGPWGWIVLGLLAAGLVFCHGCHGEDVDDELSLLFIQPQVQHQQP